MKTEAEIVAANRLNNAIRAERAKQGIGTYVRVLDGEREVDEPECLAEAISDFLADLMHLCSRSGVQFEDCLETGQSNYQGERDLDEFEQSSCEGGGLGRFRVPPR